MSYTIIVTRTWYHVESDEVETWQTDPHRTERDSMEYDDDAREEYGSPVKWAVAMLGNERIVATPGMAGFPVLKPSGWPIPDAIADTWWMSGYTPDNYTNEECETTVRLSGEWAPEQRAQVFRMATEG